MTAVPFWHQRYFTFPASSAPALNFTTFFAGILIPPRDPLVI